MKAPTVGNDGFKMLEPAEMANFTLVFGVVVKSDRPGLIPHTPGPKITKAIPVWPALQGCKESLDPA